MVRIAMPRAATAIAGVALALGAVALGSVSSPAVADTGCSSATVTWKPTDGTTSNEQFSNLGRDSNQQMNYVAAAPWYPYKIVATGTKGTNTDRLPYPESAVVSTDAKGDLAGKLVSVKFYTTTCVGTRNIYVRWHAPTSAVKGSYFKVTGTVTSNARPVAACIYLDEGDLVGKKHRSIGTDTVCSGKKGTFSVKIKICQTSYFRVIEPKNPTYVSKTGKWRKVTATGPACKGIH